MCATPQIVFLTQFFPFCLLCLIRRLQDCVLTWDSPKPRYDLMKTMNYCKAQKGPTSESQHLLVNREDSLSSHNAFLPFICSLCKLSGVTWDSSTDRHGSKYFFFWLQKLIWTNSTKSSHLVHILLLTNIFQRSYFVTFGGSITPAPMYFEPWGQIQLAYLDLQIMFLSQMTHDFSVWKSLFSNIETEMKPKGALDKYNIYFYRG